MRLNAPKLGLSAGILWGLALLFSTWVSMYTGWGIFWLSQWIDFYPGYDLTWIGSLIGLLYGFVDGFVCFFLLGWLYNRFNP